MKISLICVFNNREKLEQQLLSSLSYQSVKPELILLDNTGGAYLSAARAYNEASGRAAGDVLIFAHQDIRFKDSGALGAFAEAAAEAETGTVIGAIGVREPVRKPIGNYTDGPGYRETLPELTERRLYPASSVDECLFGMKKETWEAFRFDEALCDGWHLYAAELCLRARKNGHQVYVYPIQLHHFSRGKVTRSYMETLKRLCGAYRREFRYIWTTCYKVRTAPFFVEMLCGAWTVKRFLWRDLK